MLKNKQSTHKYFFAIDVYERFGGSGAYLLVLAPTAKEAIYKLLREHDSFSVSVNGFEDPAELESFFSQDLDSIIEALNDSDGYDAIMMMEDLTTNEVIIDNCSSGGLSIIK